MFGKSFAVQGRQTVDTYLCSPLQAHFPITRQGDELNNIYTKEEIIYQYFFRIVMKLACVSILSENL